MHLSMCAQEFKLHLKNLGTGIRTGKKVFQQGLKAFEELEKKWEDYLCLPCDIAVTIPLTFL